MRMRPPDPALHVIHRALQGVGVNPVREGNQTVADPAGRCPERQWAVPWCRPLLFCL